MNRADRWPNKDELLMLGKEAMEQRRSWGIVAGLSKALLAERTPSARQRKMVGEKPESWNDRIHTLEQKIIAQRTRLAALEECRKFELETEGLLVEALHRVVDEAHSAHAEHIAAGALRAYDERMGPRPIEVDLA